jgi:hypothetical protein
MPGIWEGRSLRKPDRTTSNSWCLFLSTNGSRFAIQRAIAHLLQAWGGSGMGAQPLVAQSIPVSFAAASSWGVPFGGTSQRLSGRTRTAITTRPCTLWRGQRTTAILPTFSARRTVPLPNRARTPKPRSPDFGDRAPACPWRRQAEVDQSEVKARAGSLTLEKAEKRTPSGRGPR